MVFLGSFYKLILQRRSFILLALFEIGLAYVIYTNVFHIQRLTGMPILDMEIGYTVDRVNEIFAAYGPLGFAHYRIIMVADIIHPAVYATLMGAVMWVLADGRRMKAVSILPLFVALFDWAENLMIWRMVSDPFPVDYRWAEAGNILSYLKHGTLALVFVLLALLLFRRMMQALFY